MTPFIMCTAAVLNIFSAPAGYQVVGQVPYGKAVQIQDTSLLRDWVYIGKPDPSGALPSPRGWVIYAGSGSAVPEGDPNVNNPICAGRPAGCHSHFKPRLHQRGGVSAAI